MSKKETRLDACPNRGSGEGGPGHCVLLGNKPGHCFSADMNAAEIDKRYRECVERLKLIGTLGNLSVRIRYIAQEE